MKIFKKILLSILIIVTTLTISQITILELPTVSISEASSIRINKTKYTLHKGSSFKLKISGTSKKVKWSSSNKKIATVNSNGKVTAKKKALAQLLQRLMEKNIIVKFL